MLREHAALIDTQCNLSTCCVIVSHTVVACDVELSVETKLRVDCLCAKKNKEKCKKKVLRIYGNLGNETIPLNLTIQCATAYKGKPHLKLQHSSVDVTNAMCGSG